MLKVHAKKLGDTAILCLQGRIARSDSSALREAVHSQSGASTLVLDLTRVSGIDAGGLGSLLELREETLARKIAFRLINITRLVRHVLEITRLDSVFEISAEKSTQSIAMNRAKAA